MLLLRISFNYMVICPFKAPDEISLLLGERQIEARRFEQREGLSFTTCGYQAKCVEPFESWPFNSFSQIIFVLRGKLEFSFSANKNRTVQSGEWFALSLNGHSISGTCYGQVELAIIECSSEIWKGLANEQDALSHAKRACVGCSQRTGAVFIKDKMNSSINTLASELFPIEGNNSSERLLVQAKTLELLSLVSHTSSMSHSPRKDPCLREFDHDSISAAAAFIETNLDADHSLAAISRQAAINEFKLKKGFRERFGTTVFGYLRQKRMERAREFLTTENCTVMEVANKVGYSNPSHFTRAFRESFGINPKEFIANRTQ